MNQTRLSLMIILIYMPLVAVQAFAAQESAPQAAAAEAQQTYEEIEKTLGAVPSFIRHFPEEGVAAAWEELKSVQLNPETAISGKYKELIGLAVAAQIPCDYCVYFHTEAAKLNGANERELREALAMAAITRHWSTILNGSLIDMDEFREEADAVFEFVKDPEPESKPEETTPVTDAASAYEDIERTLGSVPTFLRRFPEVGIAGAWREMKAVQLNPETAISGKYKELIGLAVAAQIPCHYCVYFHTEAAKLNGASDEQVREALAMAAITRHWSTVLNGSQIDEAEFRKETDQIINTLKDK